MSIAPANNPDVRPDDSERDEVLNDVGSKWSRFTRQELSALKTNDELVTQVVAKYGIEKAAAQRDVDALMAGRSLAA